jgi:hypothetical protein
MNKKTRTNKYMKKNQIKYIMCGMAVALVLSISAHAALNQICNNETTGKHFNCLTGQTCNAMWNCHNHSCDIPFDGDCCDPHPGPAAAAAANDENCSN